MRLHRRNPDSPADVSGRKRSLACALAIGLPVLLGQRLRGEDHADYRFNNYQEEASRIRVLTHSAFFELASRTAVTLSGEYVYDAISGASPTGAPPPKGSHQVPLATLEDVRRAGSFSAGIRWRGNQTTTPQIAYSEEHDYKSVGASLTHAIDLNEKNTTLSFGLAYTYDEISPKFWNGDNEFKNSADFLIGLSQLLGPKTVFAVNFTYGTSHGYLSDPYKVFRFSGYPLESVTFPEKRPGYRDKQIGFMSLTHFFAPLDGSAELTYRLYHDSYGIVSHAVGAGWFQKLGRHILVSPLFRFMDQSAADFYAVQLPGDPTVSPDDPFSPHIPIPDAYSADYRLSHLQTFAYGLNVSVMLKAHLTFDVGYRRYEMYGKDHQTSPSAYPKANIFSAGLRLRF